MSLMPPFSLVVLAMTSTYIVAYVFFHYNTQEDFGFVHWPLIDSPPSWLVGRMPLSKIGDEPSVASGGAETKLFVIDAYFSTTKIYLI
jgi:hypothetical protein